MPPGYSARTIPRRLRRERKQNHAKQSLMHNRQLRKKYDGASTDDQPVEAGKPDKYRVCESGAQDEFASQDSARIACAQCLGGDRRHGPEGEAREGYARHDEEANTQNDHGLDPGHAQQPAGVQIENLDQQGVLRRYGRGCGRRSRGHSVTARRMGSSFSRLALITASVRLRAPRV